MVRLAKNGGRAGALACAVLAVGQLLGGLAVAAQRPREVLVDSQPLTDFDAGGVAPPAPFRTLEARW